MAASFEPGGLPYLVGSLPVGDHEEAAGLVFGYTPEIPIWVQLPVYAEEGMIPQFLPGFPGVKTQNGKTIVDTMDDGFSDALVSFFEEYMAVMEGRQEIDASRFALKPDTAKGFFVFLEKLAKQSRPPAALKGQITGPVTFSTGLKNQSDMAVFYDPQTRDAAVKLLALKAKWQARKLVQAGKSAIVVLDEPALAGFGTSEFISITQAEVIACFDEIIAEIHAEGALSGIHVCANTDWSVVLDSRADLVNFDAYAYFDKFRLYANEIAAFLEKGGLIAWGIVPTLLPEDIERESVQSLFARFQENFQELVSTGIDKNMLYRQSLITPSCGTGSLNREHAVKVLELTRSVSEAVRRMEV
jgi:methionine synthase II (cobalamin-independent)